MKAPAHLLGALLAMACAALPAAQAQTLVRGHPPLTQAMVDRVTGLLGELLGLPLAPEHRERLRATYVATWKARKADEMETFQTLDQLAQALAQATPAQRAQVLQELRAQLVPALRAAAATDPDARWLLVLHDEAQRGAQGNRPLPAPPAAAVAAAPAASPAANPAAPRPALPAAAPGAPGLRFAAPPGWAVENHASGTAIFRRTFTGGAEHHATLMLFPPLAAPRGPAAAFEAEWRAKLGGPDGFDLGDVVAHYRQRLPGGPAAYYMGTRTWKRIDGRDRQFYLALWVVDLLDGRTQTVGLNVEIGRMNFAMSDQELNDAMPQVVKAVAPLLDSLRYPDGRTPGPLVAREEVIGRWGQSSAAFGGSYVHAATGQSAGASYAASGGELQILADGRYTWRFSSAYNNPVAGMGGVSQSSHSGRWTLQDQTLVLTPERALPYNPNEVAVGAGTARTPQGPRRMLITVRTGSQPPWFPLWNEFGGGIMNWYTEER